VQQQDLQADRYGHWKTSPDVMNYILFRDIASMCELVLNF